MLAVFREISFPDDLDGVPAFMFPKDDMLAVAVIREISSPGAPFLAHSGII